MTNYKKINYKLWELKKMKPAEIKIAATIMTKVCTDNLTFALPYKITAITIARITAANLAFEPLSNEPKEKRGEHKITTTSIKSLFSKYIKIKNLRLRGSLIAMLKTEPDLYYQLYNLTYDDKLGAHSHFPPSVLTGLIIVKVINALTGEPIEGVGLRAVGFPLVTYTDNFGMAIIELPIGSHVIKLIYFDYQSNEFTIVITTDEQHKDVAMTLVA